MLVETVYLHDCCNGFDCYVVEEVCEVQVKQDEVALGAVGLLNNVDETVALTNSPSLRSEAFLIVCKQLMSFGCFCESVPATTAWKIRVTDERTQIGLGSGRAHFLEEASLSQAYSTSFCLQSRLC